MIMLPLFLVLAALVPYLAYNRMKKESIVERLRNNCGVKENMKFLHIDISLQRLNEIKPQKADMLSDPEGGAHYADH